MKRPIRSLARDHLIRRTRIAVGRLGAVALASSAIGLMALASAQAAVYTNVVLADNPLGYYRMSETSGTVANDATTPAENGAYVSGVTLGVAGPRPSAFLGFEPTNIGAGFDGNHDTTEKDQLEITSFTTLNDSAYSFEVWVNYQDTGANLQYFGGRGTAGAFDAVGVALNNGAKLVFFNGASDVYSSGPLSSNQWHHVVYTRDNTAVRVYVDGALEISTTSAINYGTSDRIVAGSRPDQFWYLNGSLDELAIYDTALTAQQVLNHFDAALPEPSAAMLLGLGGLLLFRRRSTGCAGRL